MTAMTITKPGGCGCGGGGCSGNCGCGGTGSAICADGAMARPRFFAGQLLTQEDLQLIVDYVVGKNRLHNRFLFGEGVVCGLSVTCPPCGDGSVAVAPGYALDCCGNDIYLPCATTLDINALVRDLRKRQLDGAECGDPCEVKRCDDGQAGQDGQNAALAARGAARRGEDVPSSPTYRYCLYIRYKESEVAPVAPYVTDGACGAVACEPSRICEGYAFELRCDTEHPDPVDILTRLKACIGDLREAAAQVQRAQVYAARGTELKYASAMLSRDDAGFDATDLNAMSAATDRLNAAGLGAEGARPSEARLRSALADYQLVGASLARSARLARADRPEGLEKAQAAARQALDTTGAPLADLSGKLIAEPVARASAADMVGLVKRTVLPNDGASPDAAEARMLRAGVALSADQLDRMQRDLGGLKSYLQDRLMRGGITNCALLDRLQQIRIGDEAVLDQAGVSQTAEAAQALAVILLEMLRDCFCLALNPPCAPCDDPALLLACITVRDCEVVDICNMGRRFVLSPAALRYWLPPVTMLGKLFEKLCCDFEARKPRRPVPVEGEPERLQPALSFYRTSAAPRLDADSFDLQTRAVIAQTGMSVADVEQLSILGGQVGTLALSHAPVALTALGAFNLPRSIGEKPAPAVDADGLKAEMAKAIDDRLAAAKADSDKAIAAAREEASKAVIAAREEAAKAIEASRAGLAKAIGDAPEVKTLTTENGQLKAELKRVSEALKKLQPR